MEYLALPLILHEGYLPRADLKQSLTYSIGLLLSTRAGMMPFDPEFGCDLWDKEYSDLVMANKGDIRASLRNAIDKFEKRLYNVSVSFVSVSNSQPHALGLVVKVSANYRDDGEEKKFEASYSVG